MGMMGEMEKKMEEEERKLIHDIVKELPLVPDRVRCTTQAQSMFAHWRPACARACWATRAAVLGARRGRSGGARSAYIQWRFGYGAAPQLHARSAARAQPGFARGRVWSRPSGVRPVALRVPPAARGATCDRQVPPGHAPSPTPPPCGSLERQSPRTMRRCGRGSCAHHRSVPAAASGTALVAPTVRFFITLSPPAPQVAYWWVVHAGPLNCGPDREHVEKELILHHKKL